jgi:type III secretory pathway component EscR
MILNSIFTGWAENNKGEHFMKGVFFVAQINQLELQNIRHLIGQHETAYKKLSTYAQQCTDPQLKQFFQQSAQEAQTSKQKLMTFLS